MKATLPICILATLTAACPPLVASTVPSDAQAISRRHERPLVPRSQARREADRQAARNLPQRYVPGHFVWDNRRGQYSWVASRWERYDPTHAFVGGGLQFRNGQWTVGPTR